MAVNESFRSFVLDQLSRVATGVRSRSMFGGVGIYSGDLFFALIDGDTLYLKVGDSNRGDFEARGLGPFRPFGDATATRLARIVSGDTRLQLARTPQPAIGRGRSAPARGVRPPRARGPSGHARCIRLARPLAAHQHSRVKAEERSVP